MFPWSQCSSIMGHRAYDMDHWRPESLDIPHLLCFAGHWYYTSLLNPGDALGEKIPTAAHSRPLPCTSLPVPCFHLHSSSLLLQGSCLLSWWLPFLSSARKSPGLGKKGMIWLPGIYWIFHLSISKFSSNLSALLHIVIIYIVASVP